MLPRLRPRRFYDLVIGDRDRAPRADPGGMVHPYLRRRAGEEPYDIDEFPALREVLERTLGVPLFQEQVMRMAVVAAGFTPGEADQLRRAMGAWKKRGIVESFHGKFVSGMLGNGYPREFAERVFDQIRGFGDYGFPEPRGVVRAHRVRDRVAQALPSRGVHGGALEQPADGFLRAGAARSRRARARGRGARGGCQRKRLGLHSSRKLESAARARERRRAEGCMWEPGPALRLGLRMVKGLGAEPAARLVAARAAGIFASVELRFARAARQARRRGAGRGRRVRFVGIWSARRCGKELGLGEKPPLFEAIEF